MTRRPFAALQSPGIRAAILVVVLAMVVMSLAVPLRSWLRQGDENAALSADVAAREQRIAELEDEVARWQDNAYVEKQARERLHWVYPGETSYIVMGKQGEEQQELLPPTGTSGSWYERLWKTYEESAETTEAP